jgi:hypothetical protein
LPRLAHGCLRLCCCALPFAQNRADHLGDAKGLFKRGNKLALRIVCSGKALLGLFADVFQAGLDLLELALKPGHLGLPLNDNLSFYLLRHAPE